MSPLVLVFVLLGALATALFVAGYVRGARIALASYDDATVEVDDSGDIKTYWWPIALAVVAATAIVALAGVHPLFIYAGPLLAIVTAAANGAAFFLDDDPRSAT
ncbi:hypothetical protein [Hansschlegelia sp. KR7-227]|uniref:hypothetical protein n=1 Tax=Hansschlegelia sp. KR7-227 TaxID=3400914 RepID=UPI003C03EE89